MASWIRELEIDVAAGVLSLAGRSFAGLGDKTMLRLLAAVRPVLPDKGMRDGLDELVDAIKDGPPNTDTLRRMLKESRYDEIREFVENQFFFKEMDCEEI